VWAIEGRVKRLVPPVQTDVELYDFVAALAAHPLPRFRERVAYHDNLAAPRPGNARRKPLRVNDLLVELNRFLAAHAGYHVVAESGDALFGGLELRLSRALPRAGLLRVDGFGVPAAMGAQIGTGVRPLVLTGDGAFQMTGAEISHAPRHGLTPIVVLVNNGGWGIFRPVSPRQDLLEIPNCPTRAGPELGRRRLRGRERGGAGRGAARRARGEGLRADRVPHRARRPLADQPPLHPRERAQEQGCVVARAVSAGTRRTGRAARRAR